jgi:transcriptional regulator with PAS, ATPase and Fis domain
MPMITKAEIIQTINLDDGDIEKLQHVKGNVYIINSNTGSVNFQQNFTDCISMLLESGQSFQEIVNMVKCTLIQLALGKSKNYSEAGQILGLDRRSVKYHYNKYKRIENKKKPGR